MPELAVLKNEGGPDLLDMVTRFYQSIFTLSPEELSRRILSEAAKVFQADIATWFLVTEDRRYLKLVDVYNEQGEQTSRPDIKPYELKWDAKDETKVEGLTSWVAISGKPLIVDSLNSLLNEHGKAHKGKWDQWLYPEGIGHPESGFLCLYAVPLFLPIALEKGQERILGILKVERRARRKKVFTPEERKAFDIIANIMGFAYIHSERQKSLTLVDIGHSLIRPIADVALALDTVAEGLREDQNYEREKIENACRKLRGLSAMLRIAKDAFNEPTGVIEMELQSILQPQLDAIALLTGCKVDVQLNRISITATRGVLAALLNVIINLVDNAIRAGQKDKINTPIKVGYEIAPNGHMILSVENETPEKITGAVLDKAKAMQNDENMFRGLPRSFQLVARNGWELIYSYNNQRNRFELATNLTVQMEEKS